MEAQKVELKDEELDQVVGGFSEENHIGKYDGVVGQTYYFVYDDDHSAWCRAVLTKTYEKTKWIFFSERWHNVHILEYTSAFVDVVRSSFKIDFNYSLNSSFWTMYTSKK